MDQGSLARPGEPGGEPVTKQLVRISLTRLLQLSGELARLQDGSPSALVPIRERAGGRSPVFLVHPVGGSAVSYYALSRALNPEQPVYAFENQAAMNPGAPLYGTVEEMAAAYAELAVAAFEPGPYLLGGYSMGGLVAFEMARQLVAAGRQVALVAIVDTPARLPAPSVGGGEEGLTPQEVLTVATIVARRADADVALDVRELERLGPEERVDRLIEALRERGVLPPEADAAAFREILRAIRSNDAAQRRYRPLPYDGDVDLLRSTRGSSALSAEVGALTEDPTFGWQEVCRRPVTVSSVEGTHLGLLDRPSIGAVGEWLQRRIDDRLAAVAPA